MHLRLPPRLFACCALLLAGSCATSLRADPEPAGTTTVLKWRDGKKAVFLLQFDDSAPSAITNVIPELTRRGMVGTFYINPGNGPFKNHQQAWESEVPKTAMVYANHTFTHVGAKSVEQLDEELRRCSEVIEACFPAAKKPRLVSFGQPGGVPWTVTPEEKKAPLAKYHLIERPPFKGYPFTMKTKEEMLALVDHALATGEMEYNVFHGVGGDWLVTPLDIFTALLDKLDANKTQLWVTDPVSWHQYVTERKGAVAKILVASPTQIRISLTCPADPALYDLPLTLTTQVPPAWKQCLVKQGTASAKVTAADGVVQYDAVPGGAEISIQPAAN